MFSLYALSFLFFLASCIASLGINNDPHLESPARMERFENSMRFWKSLDSNVTDNEKNDVYVKTGLKDKQKVDVVTEEDVTEKDVIGEKKVETRIDNNDFNYVSFKNNATDDGNQIIVMLESP